MDQPRSKKGKDHQTGNDMETIRENVVVEDRGIHKEERWRQT